ncbi:MAG: TIGR02757 family protein [Desulfobacterales bacterium]|nr:TIGR02757 family protein [Desulfobacterales bacterium]
MASILLILTNMRIKQKQLREKLDILYDRYNQREFVDPDPLLFLYDYPDLRDREIVGLIASCLAYGRVEMIMKTVGAVLTGLGPSPYGFIMDADAATVRRAFKGFKYRFATDLHLTALLTGIQGILKEYGSLAACFGAGQGEKGGGLGRIYKAVAGTGDVGHLLADPEKTSACKRSHLFLRWMVREDVVDPGGWEGISPGSLVYPIDTHMYKIGSMLGFTRRKSADRRCAMEITQGFKKINPGDPVKYDFALTRFGIRRQFDVNDLKRFIKEI